MQTSLPVALSAQLAAAKRLDTIANNIANARTAGIRAEEVKFESYLSRADAEPVAFVSEGTQYISTRAGEMTQTGNGFDLAISGTGFFAVQGPNGTAYTRDGRLQMDAEGTLRSVSGDPILDVGGAPLQVDPSAGPLSVARDGMITQNGRQVGAVGLFDMPAGANLTRAGPSAIVPDRPATPIVEFNETQVVQGFVEGSNVNPILEMTRLIEVQRAFESAANFLTQSEQSLDRAVQVLGSKS